MLNPPFLPRYRFHEATALANYDTNRRIPKVMPNFIDANKSGKTTNPGDRATMFHIAASAAQTPPRRSMMTTTKYVYYWHYPRWGNIGTIYRVAEAIAEDIGDYLPDCGETISEAKACKMMRDPYYRITLRTYTSLDDVVAEVM